MFPQLDYLRQAVAVLPDQTEVIVLFVPYHQSRVPVPGSLSEAVWNSCKQQITEIVGVQDTAHVVDFMIRSELTMADDNYWDPLHFTDAAATTMVQQLAEALDTRRSNPAYYHYLGPEPSAD